MHVVPASGWRDRDRMRWNWLSQLGQDRRCHPPVVWAKQATRAAVSRLMSWQAIRKI
jgi:hypothetical protein